MSKYKKLDHEKFITDCEKYSYAELSIIYSVHPDTINDWKRKMKLTKPNKKFDKELFRHYYEQGLKDRDISKLMNCHEATVGIHRRKMKLKSKYKTNDSVKIKFSCFQQEALIGTLLGDTSINKYGVISFAHAISQEQYFLHKYWLFKPLTSKYKYYSHHDKRTNKIYKRIQTHCITCPLSKSLRHQLYPEGIKIISEDTANKFTLISLAYLYMDDGSYKNPGSYLCLQGFDDKSISILCKKLKTWSLTPKLDKQRNLYFNKKQTLLLHNLIVPYINKNMYYKIASKVLVKFREFGGSPEVGNPEPSAIEI